MQDTHLCGLDSYRLAFTWSRFLKLYQMLLSVKCILSYILHFFQLKRELFEAHSELTSLYEDLRSSSESLQSLDDIDMEALEQQQQFKPGCLTTFVHSFKDVVMELAKSEKEKIRSVSFFGKYFVNSKTPTLPPFCSFDCFSQHLTTNALPNCEQQTLICPYKHSYIILLYYLPTYLPTVLANSSSIYPSVYLYTFLPNLPNYITYLTFLTT